MRSQRPKRDIPTAGATSPTSIAAAGRTTAGARRIWRREDDSLHFVHRERDARAIELGARSEQRLAIRDLG